MTITDAMKYFKIKPTDVLKKNDIEKLINSNESELRAFSHTEYDAEKLINEVEMLTLLMEVAI